MAAKKRATKRATDAYASYIYKVLKSVHPDLGISKGSMKILEAFVADMFLRIASKAAQLARDNQRHTISDREIKAAAKIVLVAAATEPVAHGQAAVARYNAGLAGA
jgi:histone H2B